MPVARSCVPLIAITFSLVASGAFAEDTVDYRAIGDWDIRVDQSLNYGCFMFGSYTRGEIIRLGFDRQNQNGYLMLSKADWVSLEAGKTYMLTLQFGEQTPWQGNAAGLEMNGSKALYIKFDDPKLLREFASQPSLSVTYKDRSVAQLPLTDSSAATGALLQCQEEVESMRKGTDPQPRDPFSEISTTPQSDPFSN